MRSLTVGFAFGLLFGGIGGIIFGFTLGLMSGVNDERKTHGDQNEG